MFYSGESSRTATVETVQVPRGPAELWKGVPHIDLRDAHAVMENYYLPPANSLDNSAPVNYYEHAGLSIHTAGPVYTRSCPEVLVEPANYAAYFNMYAPSAQVDQNGKVAPTMSTQPQTLLM